MSKLEDFIGDKSFTFSFRMGMGDVKDLVNGKQKVIEIKGQKFVIQKVKEEEGKDEE